MRNMFSKCFKWKSVFLSSLFFKAISRGVARVSHSSVKEITIIFEKYKWKILHLRCLAILNVFWLRLWKTWRLKNIHNYINERFAPCFTIRALTHLTKGKESQDVCCVGSQDINQTFEWFIRHLILHGVKKKTLCKLQRFLYHSIGNFATFLKM